MNDKRFRDHRKHRFSFGEPSMENLVLVVCPNCGGKASIIPNGDPHVRCSCLNCGYTAGQSSARSSFHWHEENPTDGYFGLDLWLRTSCTGHTLWAFNTCHLDFLESYVSARLRAREKDEDWGWRNASLASRLPKWIKSSKNREALLKAIAELKAKV